MKTSRTPQTRPQLINDQGWSTSQETIPIALMAGEQILPVQWVSQVYRLRTVSTDGGKKGGQTYVYYGTIVGIFGHGPFTKLKGILQDGAAVWPNAEPFLPGSTYASGHIVYYQGVFYKAGSGTSATPPSAPWSVVDLRSSSAGVGGYTSLAINYMNVAYGTIRLYWGTLGQTADPVLTDTTIMSQVSVPGSVTPQIHPAYAGIGYVVLDDYLFGQGQEDPPNLQVIVERPANQTVVTGSAAALNDGQANLVAFTAEVLTNNRYGTGLPSGTLDATSFQAAADYLDANAALAACSPLLTQQDQLRSFAEDVGTYSDAYLRHNVATGLIEAGVWKHGTTPSTYATVSEKHLENRPKITSHGWAEATTGSVCTFNDRTRLFKSGTSAPVTDLRALNALGEERNKTQARDWVTRLSQASAQATEWIRYNSLPPAQVELSVRRSFALGTGVVGDSFRYGIRPGDWILLDVDPEPGGAQVLQFCRVLERKFSRTGPVTISATADPTLTPILFQPAADPFPLTQQSEPLDVTSARIVECPPLISGGLGWVFALAQRAEATTVGFDVLFDSQIDPSGNYVSLGVQRAFATRATLAADLDYAASGYETTIATPSSSSLLQLVVPNQIDSSMFNGVAPGVIGASDDSLLLILVGTAGSYVDEDGNDAGLIEVLSVVTWAAVSSSGGSVTYAVDALRCRRGTIRRTFAAATTEAWLIPRSQLVAMTHQDIGTLQANRGAGTTPAYGLFRLQTYSARATRSESDCADFLYRVPLSNPAAPALTWQTPGITAFPYTFATSAGGTLALNGLWHDEDANIAHYSLAWRTGTDPGTEVSVFAQSSPPAQNVNFSASIPLTTSGVYTVYARCVDALGISTEKRFEVIVPSATPQVDFPSISPPGGASSTTFITVTMDSTTSGAQLSYAVTTTGTSPGAPTPGTGAWSALVSKPATVSVTVNQTVWVFGRKSGLSDSNVASASYWSARGGNGPRQPF